MGLVSDTPPARSQDLGKALCSQERVEVFAIAGLEVATVAYAWRESPTADEENGRIVTVLGSKGIDNALAAVRASI